MVSAGYAWRSAKEKCASLRLLVPGVAAAGYAWCSTKEMSASPPARPPRLPSVRSNRMPVRGALLKRGAPRCVLRLG